MVALIDALGLRGFFERAVFILDAALRRWPWLYRRLGGEE